MEKSSFFRSRPPKPNSNIIPKPSTKQQETKNKTNESIYKAETGKENKL